MNEKILARIRKLLGEGSEVSDEQIVEAFKGTKFVDLNEGGYHSEETVSRRIKTKDDEISTLKGELKDLKAATDGDDGLKKQVATLKEENEGLKKKLGETEGKLTKAERKALVDEKLAHLSPKLRRLAMTDAEELVSETVDFATALDKVVADDPDYAAPTDEDEDETASTKVKANLGTPPKGKSPKGETEVIAAVDAVFSDGKPAADDK